jgi:hypothetical protein
MLTVQDCLAMCELSEDEVRAIAQHEHIPEVVAAELGNYLVHTPEGERRIAAMIVDDIAAAAAAGDLGRAAALKLVLKHFAEQHQPPAN